MELGLVPYLSYFTAADARLAFFALPQPYSAYFALQVAAIITTTVVSLMHVSRNAVTDSAPGLDRGPWAQAALTCARGALALATGEAIDRNAVAALVDALGLTGAALYLPEDETGRLARVLLHGEVDVPQHIGCATWSGCSGDHAPGSDWLRSDAAGNGKVEWHPLRTSEATVGALALGCVRSGVPLDACGQALVGSVAAQLTLALAYRSCAAGATRQRIEIERLRERDAAIVIEASARQPSHAFPEIVGASEALGRVLALVERVATSDAVVLVTGETGTGKELIARAIHERSSRANGPLVSINCPAIPSQLAESELFGHERGAFTDAATARPGRFELADGGTLFLDEVADLPLDVQAKLLRVLQEREIQRVGGRTTRRIDVRIIAATNRDLRAAVRAGRFRDDLYYRLATVEIALPPLRERLGDVPLLAAAFAASAAAAREQPVPAFSRTALQALSAHGWPGNVRELQNAVERAVLLCSGEVITLEHLPDWTAQATATRFGPTIRTEKRRRIEHALTETGGNQAAAARMLGVSRSNLARMMKSLGVEPARRRVRALALQ